MFWTSERVNRREEATGVGARKRSTAAIHAAEGGTGTRTGIGTVNGGWRHSCARAPARARTSVNAQAHALVGAWAPARARTSVHAQAHALAGARAPAWACASVHAQAHALAGARARESRRGPRGTPWDQARRQCAAPSPSLPRGWVRAQSGRWEPERERGQARRLPVRPVQACPKAPYVLETPAGCLPRETRTLRADHRDAAWHTFKSG